MTTCRSPSSTIVFGGAPTRRVPEAKGPNLSTLPKSSLDQRTTLAEQRLLHTAAPQPPRSATEDFMVPFSFFCRAVELATGLAMCGLNN